MNETVYMILTNGFDPDVRVLKEANYITSLNYNVEIICWDRKCVYLNKQEEKIGNITIKRFPISSVPGTGFKQIFPFLKFIKKTRKYLKNKKIRLIHCHDLDGLITGYISTLFRKNKELIFDMHELYNHYKYGKVKPVFDFLVKNSKHIIYVNEEQIKKIKNKENLVYLPNYPVSSYYIPIEKKEANKTRINYIGAVRDEKSISTLLELGKKEDSFFIGIYGNGVFYEKIKDYQYKNCKIYGRFDGIKDVGLIYRNTDILYCVYNPEIRNWQTSYPVKLYEAVVTNTPIIVAKNTKAAKFVQENQIGECVEIDNIEELLLAVFKIKKDYKKYVENMKTISYNYSWQNVEKNLNKIYKKNGE